MFFREKVVVVTGGSAGLGHAIALAFSRAGAKLVLAARNAAQLEAAAGEILALGGDVETVPTDITVDADVARLAEAAVGRFGRVDVLVNCAGRSARGLAADATVHEFQALWEINFLAAVRCVRAFLPELRKQKGSLVNIGSLAGKSPGKLLGAYPASKYALTAYTHQLRRELEPEGVHVMLVCPGPIARDDAGRRYDHDVKHLPPEAAQPGGGVKLSALEPAWLADQVVAGCEYRWAELIVPWKARLLFALSELSPTLGDWLLKQFM